MFTSAAARSQHALVGLDTRVVSVSRLAERGWSRAQIRAQLDAARWRRVGRAIVLHNGELTPCERRSAALLNAGPRSVFTSFTAAEYWGLAGWVRQPISVLVPGGTKVRRPAELALRVHYARDWSRVAIRGEAEKAAPALVRAAATILNSRPACGLLAAGVQQRIVTAAQLSEVLQNWPATRNRGDLIRAVDDIAQGAEALSEIDLAALCRRAGLPPPTRQRVRVEPDGRRRYLDAEWILPSRRRVVVEVDGALHLVAQKWWDDQLRQNELTLTGDMVLRFPSVVVRTEPWLVVNQLRRALLVG